MARIPGAEAVPNVANPGGGAFSQAARASTRASQGQRTARALTVAGSSIANIALVEQDRIFDSNRRAALSDIAANIPIALERTLEKAKKEAQPGAKGFVQSTQGLLNAENERMLNGIIGSRDLRKEDIDLIRQRASTLTQPFIANAIRFQRVEHRRGLVASFDKNVQELALEAGRNPKSLGVAVEAIKTGIENLRGDLLPGEEERLRLDALRSVHLSSIQGQIDRSPGALLSAVRAKKFDPLVKQGILKASDVKRMETLAKREVKRMVALAQRRVRSEMTDHLTSLRETGQGIPGFAERVTAAFGKNSKQAKEFFQAEGLALKVRGAINDFQLLPPSDIAKRVESFRPKPGEKGFAQKQKLFTALQSQAARVLKARTDDGAAAAHSASSAVREAFRLAQEDPTKTGDAVELSLAVQSGQGIPPTLRRVLTKGQAKQMSIRFEGLDAQGRAGFVRGIEQAYGKHAAQVFRELATNDVNPMNRLLVRHARDPVTSRLVAEAIKVGPQELRKGIEAADLTTIRETVRRELADYISAVRAGAGGGPGREVEINREIAAVETIAYSLFKQGMSAPDAAREAARKMTLDLVEMRGSFYIPKVIGGREVDIGAVDRAAFGQKTETAIRRFDPTPLGAARRIPEGIRKEALIKAAVNSGVWVTNETGTGAFLMVPVGRTIIPLVDKRGRRYEIDFRNPQFNEADFTAEVLRRAGRASPFSTNILPSGDREAIGRAVTP